ncbi:DDB1- and CUL4-associated factor 17 isoform X2 [Rhineura floridana]|uniref:DDB1- and CUL4-associated factor 17 isoform X2 n=1 Tax=Rhineura floridana TaxID=261503 RepID=UPI002AC86D5A|nr:DDB1- and CUL4-associated factor 17 isoform X2 [Rhineura floridana]
MLPSSSSLSATARLPSSDAFKIQNICFTLTRRSQGFYMKDAGVVYRKNMGILRKLVCQETTVFKNVWTTHSTSPIAYQNGKIYFDNYRCCVSRYLSWDTPQEVMVLKSAQQKVPAAARQTGIQQSVLFFLAVFRVLPLSFIGMLELDKKIFGNSMTDAAVSHSMLIVTHSAGLVKLYSFQAVSEQFMACQVDLGHECCWNGKVGIVGKYPFGIPCNIKITDTPDLLFEVSSLENTFQIGGYPWHYIITPNKKNQKGIFHVCSLKDHTLAENGIQDMKCCSLEPDWISFHPDTSGRMLHVGPKLIKVLKLKEAENNAEQQEVIEDFVIEANRENNVNNSVMVTASGRVVKKRINLLDDDPEQETFKIVDYEDELNLLSIVAVTQIGADGTAHLDFHCNEHGTQLKSIPFMESWDVTYNHEVYFDRNIVVHIEQKPNRIFSCYVYQMICSSSKEDEIIKKEKGERLFCKKLGRTFEMFL